MSRIDERGRFRTLGYAYLFLSFLMVVGLAVLLIGQGRGGWARFQTAGHGSSTLVNFFAFVLAWLLGGVAVLAACRQSIDRGHRLFLAVFVYLGLGYVNAVREPHEVKWGDFDAYYHAAECVRQDVPIEQSPDRLYLYPPLAAVSLAPLTRFSLESVAKGFHLFNLLNVAALIPLLYLSWQRYRFSREAAALTALLLLSVNVPLSRTLIYHQMNLVVVNLMLVSLLLWRRQPLWSAVSLGLAVQLKVYPVVLVLPFLLERRWRWCARFIAGQVVIVLGTLIFSHPRYYGQFFEQLSGLKETALRNASIDSFLFNVCRALGVEYAETVRVVGMGWRAGLGLAVLGFYLRARSTFRSAAVVDTATRGGFAVVDAASRGGSADDRGDEPPGASLSAGGSTGTLEEQAAERSVLSAFVLLPVLMLVVSPSVWPHHFVFWLLSAPVVLSRLHRPGSVCWGVVAYVLIFLFPVYDIFPVSYLRLVGMLILVILSCGTANRISSAPSRLFQSLVGGLRRSEGSAEVPSLPG